MNFTFADVSTSFTHMLHQDVPADIMGNTGNSGQQKPLFAEKLNRTINEIRQYEDKSSPGIRSGRINQVRPLVDQTGKTFENAMDQLSEKLDREKGTGFVSALKNVLLMLSKGNLKDISIDSDSLEILKKILIKAGFKQSDLNEFMAQLLDESKTYDLSMDDFLDKLIDIYPDDISDKDPSPENFLEISAIPFLESILNSLKIPGEQVQAILTKADKGEKGISLELIIEKLQQIQKNSFFSQNNYQTGEGDKNFRKLFTSLGIEQPELKSSSLTLDNLVESLEKLHRQLTRNQVPLENSAKEVENEKSFDLLSALFNDLEYKAGAVENPGFEFSYKQISDQFKNELMVPGMGEKNKNNLFSLKKSSRHSADKNLSDVFKEMEVLLGQKKNGGVNTADTLKEDKKFIKQLKPGNTKLSDPGQLSASGAKTNHTSSGINIVKTKSSFNNLPAYVTRQVSKSLVRAINQGENILKIQLKPPELGRLIMTIDHTGDSIKVSIMTENHAAKEILASNVNELRTILSNSGVTLERFDVDMNSNFRQSMADAGNHSANSGNQRRNREKTDLIENQRMGDTLGISGTLFHDGTLHFVA